jgi:CheY-like chemotaxis protein
LRLRALRPAMPLVLLSSRNGAVTDPGVFNARLSKPVLRSQLRDTLRSVLTHTAPHEPDALTLATVSALREDIGLPDLMSLRVLVAEDNAVNSMVIRSMLEKLGVVADFVINGTEAVEAVARQPYDVVLMDLFMPGMDGLTATRKIRANASLQQPCIVALTANVMNEDRQASEAAGMNGFLAKPLRMGELSEMLVTLAREGAS